MSFSASQFIGKLNTLEDSQESISSASKWLLSQYREADRVAETWRDYMIKKSSTVRRKLLGIYLLNHVVQQAKSQKMDHFHKAFSKVVPMVLSETYKDFPLDLQKKVKRVTDIWYDRGIFHKSILLEIRAIIKKVNESGVHGESIKGSSKSSSKISSSHKSSRGSAAAGAVAATSITDLPSDIQKYLTLIKETRKLSQSSKSLKERFEKSAAELDVSSHVYAENYNTVVKIAQLATDSTNEVITKRKQAIELLEELLNSEKKLLEQSQTELTEIDFTLLSKDPAKVLNVNTDNDALPTYTADENDNDSDSDDERNSSSSSSSDDNDSDSNGKDNDLSTKMKRASEDIESDDPQKKLKSDNSQSNDENAEYDPFTSHIDNNKSEDDNESSEPITSNIQDLLSKLAN
ncbi:Uncharacterized protein RNJ44_00820 [Nakaseomyces bracarensis]|uniref:CID domain-containing protein n=1 Tax=Nakaseomyces bracarensis TaxID=273131 RepID=A0ABR4NS63_9SACH